MTEPDDLPPITEAMTAAGAARAAEEALRQAAHASWSGVSTAADVYTVFGAVGYSLELVPQLLDQLTAWLEAHHGQLDVSDADTTAAAKIAEVRAEVTARPRRSTPAGSGWPARRPRSPRSSARWSAAE